MSEQSDSAIQRKLPDLTTVGIIVGALLFLTMIFWALPGMHAGAEVVDQSGTAIEGVSLSIAESEGPATYYNSVTVHFAVPGEQVDAVYLVNPGGAKVQSETGFAGTSGVQFDPVQMTQGQTWRAVAVGHDGEVIGSIGFEFEMRGAWEDGLP